MGVVKHETGDARGATLGLWKYLFGPVPPHLAEACPFAEFYCFCTVCEYFAQRLFLA